MQAYSSMMGKIHEALEDGTLHADEVKSLGGDVRDAEGEF